MTISRNGTRVEVRDEHDALLAWLNDGDEELTIDPNGSTEILFASAPGTSREQLIALIEGRLRDAGIDALTVRMIDAMPGRDIEPWSPERRDLDRINDAWADENEAR